MVAFLLKEAITPEPSSPSYVFIDQKKSGKLIMTDGVENYK